MSSDTTLEAIKETSATATTAVPASEATSAANASASSATPSSASSSPFLTITQAAAVLGKSLRAIERSLLGRWGNKLPEGWHARKVKTERGEEWRIIPPPGFRIRQSNAQQAIKAESIIEESTQEFGSYEIAERSFKNSYLDQPTIVIDRSDEVEHLLRELVATQKALSEERRVHLEDMRMIHQLQSSMKLLEVNLHEQARVKEERDSLQKQLEKLEKEYNEYMNLPWWKRVFTAAPGHNG